MHFWKRHTSITHPERRILLINPVSGGNRRSSKFPHSDSRDSGQPTGEILYTSGPGSAENQVREILERGEHTSLVVAGGDGTLHEALNGYYTNGSLHRKAIPFGILPAGSSNDFYRTLQSYRPDYENALNGEKIRHCDTLRVIPERGGKGRQLLNMGSAGLSGSVIASHRESGFRRGKAAFFYHSVRSLFQERPFRMGLEWDQEGKTRSMEGEFLNVFFCNGRSSGAGMLWAPEANPFDGLLDITVVASRKRDILFLSHRVYSGQVRSIPGVERFRTGWIRIYPERSLLLELDGELFPVDRNRFSSFRVEVSADRFPLIF